jgi:hypothetical protein
MKGAVARTSNPSYWEARIVGIEYCKMDRSPYDKPKVSGAALRLHHRYLMSRLTLQIFYL